jgi:hypothetical protein
MATGTNGIATYEEALSKGLNPLSSPPPNNKCVTKLDIINMGGSLSETYIDNQLVKYSSILGIYVITFNLFPTGGTLVFDGLTTSNCPSTKTYYRSDGTYNWSYSKSGYISQSGTVTVSSNVTVNISLSPVYYTINFFVSPAGGTMTFDGEVIDLYGSSSLQVGRPNGTYNWSYSKSGYISQSGTVTISGSNVIVYVTLGPI